MGGGKYPYLNRKQFEKTLQSLDFSLKRSPAGGSSHFHWEGFINNQRRVVTIKKLPSNSDVYSGHLLKSMIFQTGLSKKEFYEKFNAL